MPTTKAPNMIVLKAMIILVSRPIGEEKAQLQLDHKLIKINNEPNGSSPVEKTLTYKPVVSCSNLHDTLTVNV